MAGLVGNVHQQEGKENQATINLARVTMAIGSDLVIMDMFKWDTKIVYIATLLINSPHKQH
jgi:hypothetical protein